LFSEGVANVNPPKQILVSTGEATTPTGKGRIINVILVNFFIR
jgi:hypothetical protein